MALNCGKDVSGCTLNSEWQEFKHTPLAFGTNCGFTQSQC